MQEFQVIPHRSIGPIQLGMGRDEVRRILGEPSSIEAANEKWGIQWPDRDFFFNNGFQVTYDSELKAVHIEAAAESAYIVTFDGIHVAAMSNVENFKPRVPINNESGYQYHFACNRCRTLSVVAQWS